MLLKRLQGHLKGHGGKNWAYIFNANPADGAFIFTKLRSPGCTMAKLNTLQKHIFRFNNHDSKSFLSQSLTSDLEG